jgi:hypothetical protein
MRVGKDTGNWDNPNFPLPFFCCVKIVYLLKIEKYNCKFKNISININHPIFK